MAHEPDKENSSIDIEPLVIEFTIYYSVLRPTKPATGGAPLLLALHGYGQKCKGFVRRPALLAPASCAEGD